MTKKGLFMGFGYPQEKLLRLPNAWEDVLRMKECAVKFLGFKAKDIILRLDESPLQNNSASHLQELLLKFVVGSSSGDELYLYMSGHGKSDKEITVVQCEEGQYNFNTPWLYRKPIKIDLHKVFELALIPGFVEVNEKPSAFLTINSSFLVGDDTCLTDCFFRELYKALPKDVSLTIFVCSCFAGGMLKHFEVVRGIQKRTRSPWIENLLNWKEQDIDQKLVLLYGACQQFEESVALTTYLTPNTFRVYSFSAFAMDILEKTEGNVLDLEFISRIQKISKHYCFPQHPCLVYATNPGGKLFLSRNCATGVVAGAADDGDADGDAANGNQIALCNDAAFFFDVTTDKKVFKQILKEGGDECLNEGAVVKLKLIGKLQDGTVFFKKGYNDGEAELFEFKTDEEQVVDGLDRAVMTMKKGEVALLTIGPEYAFGSSESQQELAVVPPNSTLYYEVELVSIVKDKESWEWDMSTEEKIEAACKKRAEGHALYKAKEYGRASKRFEQALKFIEYDTSFSDEEKKKLQTLKHFCSFYIRECKIQLNDYTDMVINGISYNSDDWFEKHYIQGLKVINHSIGGEKRMYPNIEINIDADANSYWDMFNKMKSWILEKVINVGKGMQKSGPKEMSCGTHL